MLPTRDFRTKDIHRLKVREWKKICLAVEMIRKLVYNTHIDKEDCKAKSMIKDKRGIM